MKMHDLREKLAIYVAESRSMIEAPEGKDGDFSDEQEKRNEELQHKIKMTEKKIERRQFVDDAERRIQGEQIAGTGDERLDTELRSFSIVRAIAGAAGLNVDDGRERELQAQLATRAGRPAHAAGGEGARPSVLIPIEVFEERVQTVGTDTAGGYLVQTGPQGEQYIDKLRNALIIGQLGARVLNGLVGDVEIPKLTGSGTSQWVGENQAIDEADLAFGNVTMRPRHVGMITEYSRNTLLQTSPGIEQIIRQDFAQLLAEAIDTAAITGDGVLEPEGILNNSDVVETSFTTDYIITSADMIAALDVNNANAKRAFLTTPGIRAAASKILTTDLLPITIAQHFHDEPVAFSNLVPTNLGGGTDEHGILYGDWTDMLIGYWSAFEVLVNPYETTAFARGGVKVRAMLTADISVRHAESFTYSSKAP